MARETATRSDTEVLQFPHSGKMSGFRSSGISAYNNVDPHTVIRELVQNALDASMQAGREVVRVVFEIEHLPKSVIPALSEYQRHLDSAEASQLIWLSPRQALRRPYCKIAGGHPPQNLD